MHVQQGVEADVDWTYCKHPLPEHVYDMYMRHWGAVRLACENMHADRQCG
ncbi:MAG: hypothetical protein ACXVI0_11345 [Halobacteriota archaeon]